MKKFIIVLLAILAIFTLTGCGDKDEDSSKERTSQKETKKEKKNRRTKE